MDHLEFTGTYGAQNQVGFPEFAQNAGLAIIPLGLGTGAHLQRHGLSKNNGTKNGQTCQG